MIWSSSTELAKFSFVLWLSVPDSQKICTCSFTLPPPYPLLQIPNSYGCFEYEIGTEWPLMVGLSLGRYTNVVRNLSSNFTMTVFTMMTSILTIHVLQATSDWTLCPPVFFLIVVNYFSIFAFIYLIPEYVVIFICRLRLVMSSP